MLVCSAGIIPSLAHYQSVAIPVGRETQSFGSQDPTSLSVEPEVSQSDSIGSPG